MRELKVRGMSEVPVVGPDGKVRTDVQVIYFVGEFGPFVHSVAKADYNAVAVRQALENQAREIEIVAGP